MTSNQKNNKLLYILKICFHSYVPVLPYLSFLSFPFLLVCSSSNPQPLCFESFRSQYFQRLNYAGTPWWKLQMFFHHFSLSAGTAWPLPAVHSFLPHLHPPISLNPLPLIHLLPTCRALILALHICRSYCAAINDCNAIMGKWSCLCNPLTMSWEREGKKIHGCDREFQKALSFTTVFFLSLLQTSVSEARQAMRGFHSNGAQITLIANM